MNTKIEQNMEWNEKEELKGLLAANKRKPEISEKNKKVKWRQIKTRTKLKRNTPKSSLKCWDRASFDNSNR